MQKLEQYTRQKDFEPDKARISVTKDQDTDQITRFTVEDKWHRSLSFSPDTNPEHYYILYLRVGSGHMQINLTQQLQETSLQWQEKFDREHFTIHMEDEDRILAAQYSLTDRPIETLAHYKQFNHIYNINQQDLAKIDNRIDELKKVIPLHKDRDMDEMAAEPPMPDAEFKIERNDTTGQIKHFTVYDEWHKEHVFNPETQPQQYTELTWREGYGAVNTQLPKELVETTKRWQQEYEASHIRLQESPSGPEALSWHVNIKEAPLEELDRYRENYDQYNINPHDIAKIDHWIQERSRDTHDKDLPNAQIAVDRDPNTKLITQFTVYDREQANNPDVLIPHLFNHNTTPDKWQKLFDQPETFNVKIELTPEVQLAAKFWQEKSEQEHIFITDKLPSRSHVNYWIKLAECDLEEIMYWHEYFDMSPQDQLKMEYYADLKELQELELINEKYQKDKIVDMTSRLQSDHEQDISEGQVSETKILYEAQKLSAEEISREYGSDELVNVIYMFNHSTRDYFQRQAHAQERQLGTNLPTQQTPTSGQAGYSPDITQEFPTNQDFDPELER